ncbi:radical SAM protein [bacterium]|nr:radical SAM protein [bacterium]
MKYRCLGNDIFLLESHCKDTNIVYAPLKKKMFYAQDVSADEIESSFENILKNSIPKTDLEKRFVDILTTKDSKIQKHEKFGTKIDSTVLLLTEACNLACTYCYAREQHSTDTITKEKLKTTIEFVLKNDSEKQHFSFIGGGEPFLKKDLLVWAVEYIRKHQKDKKITISVTTNATLLDNDTAKWLSKNKIHVGCSFDILPEIQNAQRPYASGKGSFADVKRSIDLLVKNDVSFGFRSTITRSAIETMPEMVMWVAENYSQIRQIGLEHVSMPGLTWNNYYKDFMTYFFVTKKIAESKNIYLKNSIVFSIKSLRNRFCGGEFCITPTGDIISCHRASNDKAAAFEQFKYGIANEKGVFVDEDKAKTVNMLYETKRLEQCEFCFAKYHCSSQCCNNKLTYSHQDFLELCNFTKEMVVRELEDKSKLFE